MESLRGSEGARVYLVVSIEEYMKDHDLDSLRSIATAKNGFLKGPAVVNIDPRELDQILAETQIIPWDAVLEALGMEFSLAS